MIALEHNQTPKTQLMIITTFTAVSMWVIAQDQGQFYTENEDMFVKYLLGALAAVVIFVAMRWIRAVDENTKAITNISQLLIKQQASIEAHDEKMEAHDHKIDGLGDKFDTLVKDVHIVREKMVNLEKDVNEIKNNPPKRH